MCEAYSGSVVPTTIWISSISADPNTEELYVRLWVHTSACLFVIVVGSAWIISGYLDLCVREYVTSYLIQKCKNWQ